MNEYPFGEEEDAGLEVESDTEHEVSASGKTEELEPAASGKSVSYNPNTRAVQARRAIELLSERAALKEMIDDSFSLP